MSHPIHTTETPNAPQSGKYASEFFKIIPTILAASLIGFGTSWCNTQKMQDSLSFRVDAVEKKAETNAGNVLQNAQAFQQIAIRQAEMSIIQTNLLEQVKDLKQEQNEIKLMLNRK